MTVFWCCTELGNSVLFRIYAPLTHPFEGNSNSPLFNGQMQQVEKKNVKDSRPDIIGPAASPFMRCASSEMHNLKHGRIVVKKIINCTSPSYYSRYTFGFM